MISVTSKSRYAVVALSELSRFGDRPMPVKEIAERRAIPDQFLEQLFSTLRRAGLLTSHRGSKGGYTLARPPEEITVLEVVQALDGKVGQDLLAKFPARNLIALAWGEQGFRHLTNSKHPVSKPADMKGLKIRTMETVSYTHLTLPTIYTG